MELHTLKPAPKSVKRNKRLGRGQGSGKAGTSGRGHKGAKSRSGYKRKRNFEGGQMPLQMRVPKRGFKNRNRVSYAPFNLSRLQEIADKYGLSEIHPEVLIKHRIVRRKDKIKVLGGGELSSALKIQAHAISESARKAVEAAGGSVNIL